MRLEPVKLHEIPLHLLQQKDWDLHAFYRFAVTDPEGWYAFLVADADEIIGAVIYAESPLYRCLRVDTLIIDKAHRSGPRMRDGLRMAREMGHILAGKLGYREIVSSTKLSLEAMQRVYGPEFKGRLIEHTIADPVPGMED